MILKRHLACAFLAIAVLPVHATLEWYDSFNYSPTSVQLAAAAGGTWVAYAGGGVHVTNTAGSLSYPGLQTATGDNSELFNGLATTGVAARKLSQGYNSNNISTLYYSLTFQVTAVVGNDWGGSG